MIPEREREIERICEAALARPRAEREAFLTEACRDENLRREVERLLAQESAAVGFLETPAAAAIAQAMVTSRQGLTAGQQIAGYTILSTLGSGGMGEVYRARDLSLGRDVAIKVLPPLFTSNAERLARFEREARALAALNHPNIITIHSIEEAAGVRFLTMELIEGHTLESEISKPRLPVDRILALAIPLADAVSAAHQRGITHRDLKPANVMVTHDSRVKVLDFGLAKLKDRESGAGLTSAQTGHTLTDEGRILGTMSYVSPEQAEGKPNDHRSDIFSLGIILYELATAEHPFKGNSQVSVLSSILKDAPRPVTEINHALPRELGRIIKHCLAKDPDRRYQTAADLRNELEELKQDLESGAIDRSGTQEATSQHRQSKVRAAAIAAVLLVVALIGGYVLIAPGRGEHAQAAPFDASFQRLTTDAGLEDFPSLSPDGKWIAYSRGELGRDNVEIYLQGVGGQTSINLTNDPAEDTQPAFSPDGRRIAFRSSRQGGGIFVMGQTGESPRRLTDGGFNPTWSPDGKEIAYASATTTQSPAVRVGSSELWAVKVATEEKRRLSEGDAVQPSWSPHGDRIAYWGVHANQRDIYTVASSGGESIPVTSDAAVDWNPVWSPDGKYLYFSSNRGGSFNLWRVAIDEKSGRTLGEPQAVTTPSPYVAHLSFSADGRHLAYASLDLRADIQKASFDPRSATVTSEPVWLVRGSRLWAMPDPSPDNQWIAFQSTGVQEDLWVSRSDGTDQRQLTNDTAVDRFNRWSPDGTEIAFASNRSGSNQIWSIRPDGSGLRQLTDKAGGLAWLAWSWNGTRIVANSPGDTVVIFDPHRPWNEQTPQEITKPGGGMFNVQAWSPDGEWLAGFEQSVPPRVAIYSLKSGVYQVLTSFWGGRINWLKDSRRLLFTSLEHTISVMDIYSRKTHVAYEAPGETVGGNVSRDNRTIYFTRGKTEGDIWMATLK